ncbi:Hypothetical_protein [Hexamita inflata]|uniref:Hypothetical_protein n=1 Tax=Hexamita inflata TaxID=28002 RepID=A0ABP1GE12_9EUKA
MNAQNKLILDKDQLIQQLQEELSATIKQIQEQQSTQQMNNKKIIEQQNLIDKLQHSTKLDIEKFTQQQLQMQDVMSQFSLKNKKIETLDQALKQSYETIQYLEATQSTIKLQQQANEKQHQEQIQILQNQIDEINQLNKRQLYDINSKYEAQLSDMRQQLVKAQNSSVQQLNQQLNQISQQREEIVQINLQLSQDKHKNQELNRKLLEMQQKYNYLEKSSIEKQSQLNEKLLQTEALHKTSQKNSFKDTPQTPKKQQLASQNMLHINTEEVEAQWGSMTNISEKNIDQQNIIYQQQLEDKQNTINKLRTQRDLFEKQTIETTEQLNIAKKLLEHSHEKLMQTGDTQMNNLIQNQKLEIVKLKQIEQQNTQLLKIKDIEIQKHKDHIREKEKQIEKLNNQLNMMHGEREILNELHTTQTNLQVQERINRQLKLEMVGRDLEQSLCGIKERQSERRPRVLQPVCIGKVRKQQGQ